MSETPHNLSSASSFSFKAAFSDLHSRLGTPVWLILGTLILLTVIVPENTGQHIQFAGKSLLDIAPFLLLSVGLASYLKASGADDLVARAFEGNPTRAIIIASIFGALSPFCSCGVIPLVAGLLASGVPLAPVLAFCIASPIMDPEMFILTAAGLGMDFAIIKTVAAIGMGLMSGFVTQAISKTGLLKNGLKEIAKSSGCGSSCSAPKQINVTWAFWKREGGMDTFLRQGGDAAWFLGRWLAFAFLLEGIMISYVPADNVATLLGDGNAFALPLAALIGVPTYMNGYAAIPLVRGLMDLGMPLSTGLTFMLAGSVTSIPAAIGFWSLAKPKIFALYLAFAVSGALIAGYIVKLVVT
ncbi:permease [Sneathiella sp. P13V-1]|uniref:permease n=1 Tax=Sneathiella sp. P13V-1 TaxID=2697366 RepID=UPI00187BB43D|nr:permease [Sneathiella sp. P13V-1]MBE7635998.1 permease [Sneathiella sp. P13V-1]